MESKKLFNGKEGMFFTIMVIFILMLFFVSYTLYDVVEDRSAVQKRIETLNSFVFSVEQDIPRYLFIAGFRSIFLMEEKIVANATYIGDVNASFHELFYNGSLDGVPKDIMSGARFSDMQTSFQNLGSKVNANVSLSETSISMNHTDPWTVRVSFSAHLLIEDLADLARWNKTVVFEADVPIQGFEDPLYIVSTGVVTNKIVKTNYTLFASGSNVTNLSDHVTNSYYRASNSSPSFLDRVHGLTAPNEYGIESFVHLPTLTAQGLSVQDKSTIDYIYFSASDPTDYSIVGMPSWFKIDDLDNHLAEYNVSALAS